MSISSLRFHGWQIIGAIAPQISLSKENPNPVSNIVRRLRAEGAPEIAQGFNP
jgi:hypothetical protein